MAVPLDVAPAQGRPGGRCPVLDPVTVDAALNGNSAVFVSRGGALVTGVAGTPDPSSTWLRSVRRRDAPDQPASCAPSPSRGCRRTAAGSRSSSPTERRRDVWIYDLDTGTLSRLTSVGTVTSVEWTRDGSAGGVLGSGERRTKDAIWAQSVGGAASRRSWSSYRRSRPSWTSRPTAAPCCCRPSSTRPGECSASRSTRARVIRPFSASGRQAIGSPHISPDGRWAALTSDESGAFEVYVRSFPEPTSEGAGLGGRRRRPGLVGRRDPAVLRGRGQRDHGGAARAPTPACGSSSRDTAFTRGAERHRGFGQANYDVSRDGSRHRDPERAVPAYPLVVVPNWRTELRERLQASQQSP